MSSAGMPTQRLHPASSQWQYHVVRMNVGSLLGGPNIDPQQVQDILNQLGADGWELVNTVDINGGQGSTRDLIFICKRAIRPQP